MIEEVLSAFKKLYPKPQTELNYQNEYQFFVAVILSAQTTDKKVNSVTKGLFEKYPTWEALAKADLKDVQELIHGVNFHKGKADRLIKAAQMILADFDGALPHGFEDLIKLPGAARKSANVISQELWGEVHGIVVDTHISRVSQRLRLTTQTTPQKIEQDLMKVIPRDSWRLFSSACVLFGRYTCTAIKPKCSECPLNKSCPSAFKA